MNQKNNLKKLLAKYSKMQEFKKEEKLYNFNDKAENIYFILSGLVRVYVKNNGKTIELKRLKNGQFVGETAMTADYYHSRAEAYIKTRVLKFSPDNLRKIIAENSSFAGKMINNLCEHLVDLENIDKLSLPPISEVDKKIAREKEIKESLKKNKKKKKKEKIIKKAASDLKNREFYLQGHQDYNHQAKKDFEYYLYDKEIECPVCSHQFEVKKIRNSRLRINRVREDLRPIYKNFKLYYYNIWSCPECYFTARINDFNEFSKHRRKKIKKDFKSLVKKELSENFKINFKEPRSINTVLDAYYLAVKLYNFADCSEDKKTFLWREISWIYEDLGEENLSQKASREALKHLKEYYFKDDSQKDKTENDNITLLLAVLYYKHGFSQKALPLLDDLIRDARVNLRQKNKARDLFMKIREENNNK